MNANLDSRPYTITITTRTGDVYRGELAYRDAFAVRIGPGWTVNGTDRNGQNFTPVAIPVEAIALPMWLGVGA